MDSLPCKPLLVAVVLLGSMFLRATSASAADIAPSERMVTTVVYVEAARGLLWLTAPDGSLLRVEAPTQLLDGLQAADTVAVLIARSPETRAMQHPPRAPVAAVVQIADADTGLLRLITAQGAIIDLQPAKEFLEYLQPGERVQVAINKLP